MHTLRSAATLARLVLAWFVLFVGVACASPFIKPVSMELVCSAGGAARLVATAQAADEASADSSPSLAHQLDCPACLPGVAPFPVVTTLVVHHHVSSHVLLPLEAARIAALTAAPLPPRGPPFFA